MEETPFSLWRKQQFPKLNFESKVLKKAGKIFKNEGPEATLEFLSSSESSTERLPNFGPPAKARVVAFSRPPSEWLIARASTQIQEYVYSMTRAEFEKFDKPLRFSKAKFSCEGSNYSPGCTQESIDPWLDRTGFGWCRPLGVQALNLIFKGAAGIYRGAVKAAETRNEKRLARHARWNAKLKKYGREPEEFVPIPVFNEDGRLRYPPSPNNSVWCYQQISPRPFDQSKPVGKVIGYTLGPDDPIPVEKGDRLGIPKGDPGYVPEWIRPGYIPTEVYAGRPDRKTPYTHPPQYNPTKRRVRLTRRRRAENTTIGPVVETNGELLVTLSVGGDWALIDVRGLLRSLTYRGLLTCEERKELTIRTLLEKFTGDPVLDTKRHVLTFSHHKLVLKKNTYQGKGAQKELTRLTKKGPVALLSVDLGVRHPIAMRVSCINGEQVTHVPCQKTLDSESVKLIDRYRSKYDGMVKRVERDARNRLPGEYQDEYRLLDFAAETAKSRVCAKYGLDPEGLPWDKMSNNTHYIANAYLESGGDRSEVEFEYKKKGSKKKTKALVSDYYVANHPDIRPKVSKEARDLLNETKFKLQREDDEYAKLSQYKRELSRRLVNISLQIARQYTGVDTVAVVIEKLTKDNRFASGKGHRDPGWDNFFAVKRENRWFLQAIHKAYQELAPNRGVTVCEVNPYRTSITCPKCRHPDKKSRSRDDFVCTECGYKGHADADVATYNIEYVALHGSIDGEGCNDAPPQIQ